LNGNQDYGAQARVFEVLNTTTYTTGSDFPVVYKFTTGELVLFSLFIKFWFSTLKKNSSVTTVHFI